MHTYEAFYRGRRKTLNASTSLEAQRAAARWFKAKRPWEVTVVLADEPVQPASL